MDMSKRLEKRSYESGILINKAKKGKYNNPDAVSKVKRYVLGEEGSSKAGRSDVIHYGAYGAVDFLDTDFIEEQFFDVQKCYVRHGKNKRYADHEIFVFPEDAGRVLKQHPSHIPEIAGKMASAISDGEFQTFYGVHNGSQYDERYPETNGKLHIHFLVNPVSFKTFKKRQENFAATAEHEAELQRLVRAEVAAIDGKERTCSEKTTQNRDGNAFSC